jgi:hypothetical protein
MPEVHAAGAPVVVRHPCAHFTWLIHCIYFEVVRLLICVTSLSCPSPAAPVLSEARLIWRGS